MEGRSPGDLFGQTGILAELTKALAERALSTEMDVHLDEERAEEAHEGQNQAPNRRNGRSQKTVTTDSGKVVLDIPRDRNGTFDPLLIAKYQETVPNFVPDAFSYVIGKRSSNMMASWLLTACHSRTERFHSVDVALSAR